MPLPVDTSTFQLGLPPDLDPEEEVDERLRLGALWAEARAYAETRAWAPFVSEILLAYGVGPILGLFLVRFSEPPPGEVPDERERWFVVGDLPYMNFETDGFEDPEAALGLYCDLAEDWADLVLADGDISECYPIDAAPTHEHARLLKARIAFIEREIIPAYREQVSRIRRIRGEAKPASSNGD